ncbi:MAG TPA: hypothetical protein VG266_06990 [Candidatus Dormibacteraeota bacterium]|jgi:hypothetical protein|nr:hypothetical protein [Candidatus Dormibacteraeota bacterium]
MTTAGWQRRAPWSGIAFVVLLVVGFGLATSGPDPGKDSVATFHAFWSDSANRVHILMGAYFLVAAAIAFVGFAAGLWCSVSARGGGGVWVLLTAGIFATFLALGGVLFAWDAGDIAFGNTPVPSGDILRENSQLPFPILLVPGAISAGCFLVAASLLGARHALLPRWLTIAGYVAAILMLGAVVFIPFLALPLWMLLASITLLVRGTKGAAAERSPMAPTTS